MVQTDTFDTTLGWIFFCFRDLGKYEKETVISETKQRKLLSNTSSVFTQNKAHNYLQIKLAGL